jgi:hypothetical protein
MKTNWKSLAFAGIAAIACTTLSSSPAHAQALSFGYAGPGGSFGVTAGNYGYYGGGPFGGSYYGGGYYGGYPILAPGAYIAGPVAPALVRPPVVLGGPLVVPRPYGYYGRPYARYRPYPGYYRRGWR